MRRPATLLFELFVGSIELLAQLNGILAQSFINAMPRARALPIGGLSTTIVP
ncbi:MAG: hypothetical protein M2R45_04581 [Verrucomicrobia subdivision 3 bacterium]|nr:hypothetical protein [Limisphaerales bacterium]MCS1417356.1 hypothetical protein [Limisphaerales bacterium]